jgi:hypothetical protein
MNSKFQASGNNANIQMEVTWHLLEHTQSLPKQAK